MNKIELKFNGAVLHLKVELEGKEVGLYFDGASEWTRTLEKFTIEGKLDIVMLCKGLNGTKWELDIKVDGKIVRVDSQGIGVKFGEVLPDI